MEVSQLADVRMTLYHNVVSWSKPTRVVLEYLPSPYHKTLLIALNTRGHGVDERLYLFNACYLDSSGSKVHR